VDEDNYVGYVGSAVGFIRCGCVCLKGNIVIKTYDLSGLTSAMREDALNLGIAPMLLQDKPDTQAIADLWNDPRYEALNPLPIREFIGILHSYGVFDILYDAYVAGDPKIVREVGKLSLLKSLGVEDVHLEIPATIKSLVEAGIPEQVLDIVRARATVLRSAAEYMWGNGFVLSENDVNRAIWANDGSRLL